MIDGCKVVLKMGALIKGLLVELIGVNKGRRVTLKYFSILIKIDKEHRHLICAIIAR